VFGETPRDGPGGWSDLIDGEGSGARSACYDSRNPLGRRRARRNGSLGRRTAMVLGAPQTNLMHHVWQTAVSDLPRSQGSAIGSGRVHDRVQAALREALDGLEEAVADNSVGSAVKIIFFRRDEAETVLRVSNRPGPHRIAKSGRSNSTVSSNSTRSPF